MIQTHTTTEWYRLYVQTIQSLLKQYDKTASPSQWRRMSISIVLVILFVRNKQQHILDLASIARNPRTDVGFNALLVFPNTVSWITKIMCFLYIPILTWLGFHWWITHHGPFMGKWLSVTVIVGFVLLSAIMAVRSEICHYLTNTAAVKLLHLFM